MKPIGKKRGRPIKPKGRAESIWLSGENAAKIDKAMRNHPELENTSQAINWVLDNWIGSWELVKKGGEKMQYWRITLLDNFEQHHDVVGMLEASGFIEDYSGFRTFPEALDDREHDWSFDNVSEYKDCLDILQETIKCHWAFPAVSGKFNNGVQWPMLELRHGDDEWFDEQEEQEEEE